MATGGGAIDLVSGNATDHSTLLLPVTYDFSLAGKALSASIMVKMKAPSANNRATQIGFLTATNQAGANANGFASLTGVNGVGWMSAILQ